MFTDVEGSTRLLQKLGSTPYADALLGHRRRVREIIDAHRGFELGTEGDAFFIAFDDASRAIGAADSIQAASRDGPIRVRIGIHTGEPLLLDGDYFGLDVHRAARICSAAHGGQIVVSQATRDAVARELRDLGVHRLKDLTAPERLFQVGDGDFAPLRTLHRTNLPVVATPLLGFRMLKYERARYEAIIASVAGEPDYEQGVRDAEGLTITEAARTFNN